MNGHKRIHILLLLLGFACLVWMLHAMGAAQVWRQLKTVGWGLVPLVLIEGLGAVLHTAGWRRCLSDPARSWSYGRLFWVRMAGYAVNYFTPTAAMGGEVTRASMIASEGHGAEATSAVLIDKASIAFAHLMLVVSGAFLLAWRIPLPETLKIAMILSGSLLAVGIVLFMLIQKHGLLGAVFRWMRSHHLGGAGIRKLAENTSAVDEAFRLFYRDRRRDLAFSVGWHLSAFMIGIFQVWLFFVLVHQPISLIEISSIWLIGLWFDLLVFVVPMSLGTLEGSRIVTFRAIGFQAVEGMTYGMVLRLGQLSCAILGLLGYAVLTFRQAARH
jgi:hypothetical protein